MTAAAVILKIPDDARKIVATNINLALSANNLEGRYIVDHSIGKISLIPLRDLIDFSDPFKRSIFPALSLMSLKFQYLSLFLSEPLQLHNLLHFQNLSDLDFFLLKMIQG